MDSPLCHLVHSNGVKWQGNKYAAVKYKLAETEWLISTAQYNTLLYISVAQYNNLLHISVAQYNTLLHISWNYNLQYSFLKEIQA